MARGSFPGWGKGKKNHTGKYVWDEEKQEFVKVGDRPKGIDSVIWTGPFFAEHLGDAQHPNGQWIESKSQLRRVLKEQEVAQL